MKKRPLISALEPRLLFDGAAVTTAVDVLDNSSFYDSSETTDIAVAFENNNNNKKEVAFIDTGVKNYEKLLDEFDPSVEIFLLDKESNGLSQISELLKDKENIDSIHIISHGDIGKINIGNSSISLDNISLFSDKLKEIGNSLTQDADILLYGCSVAQDNSGKEFVDRFSLLTKADVAASDDITGEQSLKGDWDLEYKTGEIETVSISSSDFDEVLNTAPVLSTKPIVEITDGLPDSSFVISSGSSNAGEEPSKAFDGDTNTNYINQSALNGSFVVDTNDSYVVTSLDITSASDDTLDDPTAYTIWGSTDNSTFTQINTGTLFPPGTVSTPYGTVDLSSNTDSYRYYKITLKNFDISGVSKVSEIKLNGYKEANATYTEDDTSGVNIVPDIELNDDGNLVSATITIDPLDYETEDILSFVKDPLEDYGDITASYVGRVMTLTSSSTATDTQFQNALRAIKYTSTSDDPTANNNTRTISWQVFDGVNNSSTETSTVTIIAQNDDPVIVPGDVTGVVAEEGSLSDSGSITFSDVDSNDILNATFSNGSVTGTAQGGGSLTLTASQISSIQSGFSLPTTSGSSASWDYTVNESDIDFIGEGEVVTAVFTITVSDGNGGTDTQDVTVTISGKNDAPDIQVVDNTGSITEADGILVDTGSINFTDIDFSDRPSAMEATSSVNAVQSDLTTPITLTAQQRSDIENAFSISAAGGNINDGTINWTYSIDGSKLDFLGKDEVVTAIFTITVTDDEGSIDTQDITVTITGTTDNPVIVPGDVTGVVAEEGSLSDSGSITFSDIDSTDLPVPTFTPSTISATAQGGGALVLTAGQISQIQSGFSVVNAGGNTNNGTINWDYTVNESDIDFIGEGEVVTAVFTITVSDSNGGTDTQDVTVTISGKNDAPDIQVVAGSGTITESNGVLSDTGSITFTDIDYSDRPSAVETISSIDAVQSDLTTPLTLTGQQQSDIENAFSISAAGGNINDGTINWTYSIDGSKLDFLSQGEVVTTVYTITVTDDEGSSDTQDITVTITGTNDAPDIQIVYVNGSITEGSSLSDNGSITFTDVDLTNRPTATESTKSVTAVLKDGITPLTLSSSQISDIEAAFSISNASGNSNNGTITWDFTISEANLDFLAQNEVVTAVFTIAVDDGNGGTETEDVTLTITGTNDAPIVSSDNVDEELVYPQEFTKDISGLFSDVDGTDILTYEVNNLPNGLSYDSVTGIISGNALEVGIFDIEIKAYDSATPSLMVSRTFEMTILAPIEQDAPIKDDGEDPIIPIKPEDVKVIDFVDDDIEGVIDDSITEDDLTNIGVGFIDNSNEQSDIPNPIVSSTIQSAEIYIDEKGEFEFSEQTINSFNTLGLTLEVLSNQDNFIEMQITDIKVNQTYEVTLVDGSPLPEGITFDEKTGFIKGSFEEDLEIRIKATSVDGTVRILNLKIDVSELEKQDLQTALDNSSIGLQQQINAQSFQMESYGEHIADLFEDEVV